MRLTRPGSIPSTGCPAVLTCRFATMRSPAIHRKRPLLFSSIFSSLGVTDVKSGLSQPTCSFKLDDVFFLKPYLRLFRGGGRQSRRGIKVNFSTAALVLWLRREGSQ